jgi:hypothetical protein
LLVLYGRYRLRAVDVGDIGPLNIETANKLRTPNKLVSKISIVRHPAGRAAVLKKFMERIGNFRISAIFPDFDFRFIAILFSNAHRSSLKFLRPAPGPGNRQEAFSSSRGSSINGRHDFQAIHRESR